MRFYKFASLIVLSSLILLASVPAAAVTPGKLSMTSQRKRDKVIATKTVKGTLKGFEVGDYQHAVIKLEDGKEASYLIGEIGLPYFLALHKDEPLVLTYKIVDSYIQGDGGTERIERLSGARAGNITYAAWWKKMRAKHSFARLEKMYGSQVEKLRLNP